MSLNGSPRPDNHVIVLFGATGDLAKRKLLPGLYHLHAAGLLPKEYRIIGSSPVQYALTDEQFKEHAEQACDDFCITKPTDPSWPSFAERLSFGAAEPENTTALEEAVQRAEKEISYKDSFAIANALEGYERLILLAMVGDQSLFTRSDGIERLWEISTPLLDNPPPAEPYEPGSWGPASVDKLVAPYRWHLPEA